MKTNAPSPGSPVRAYLGISVTLLLWGLNYWIGRCLASPVLFGTVHMPGIVYGFLRYGLGAITLWVLLWQGRPPAGGGGLFSGMSSRHRRALFWSTLASSVFVLAAHASHPFVSATTTAVIVNLCPVLVLGYGLLFLGEKLPPSRLAGFGLGLVAGILFLALSWGDGAGNPRGPGILLSLLAMVAWAAYTVSLHYLEGLDRALVLALQQSAATLLVLPFLLAYGAARPIFVVVDRWSTLGLAVGGILCSAVAYLLYFDAIRALGASRTASFLTLVPVVTLLFDALLGDLPAPRALLAAALAIGGVALIRRS